MFHSLHDVRGSSFLLPAGKGGDFFGGGGGGKDHVVFRENGGRISRHQRSVKEKTDCQHTANEGNGEHCRALTGVSDKFFRGTNKILNPPPLLKG